MLNFVPTPQLLILVAPIGDADTITFSSGSQVLTVESSRNTVRFAYYQNVMHYSAYRCILHIYRMRCLNATFYALFSKRRRGRWSKRWKKAAECCRIFGFDSPSRQFIFNALS